MVSTENKQRQEATLPARTEGGQERRRNIADAAADVQPGMSNGLAEAAKIERFRVVIYLCGAPNADINGPRHECTEYAEALGWGVESVIEDRDGLSPPKGRSGLTKAIEQIEERRVGAVLTPSRSMISPVPQEYDEVARAIEKAGGFLQVMNTHRVRARGE